MAETWKERTKREVREAYAAVDEVMARNASGAPLRTELEKASVLPWFNNLSYLWGPWLWRKLKTDATVRVALRPLLLSHLNQSAMDRKARWGGTWAAAPRELEAWLAEVDAAEDLEVFRRLIQWKLLQTSWTEFAPKWRAMLLQRVKAARTPPERQSALARFDFPAQLDEPTSLALYELFGPSVRSFVLTRLPWKTPFWEKLHQRALAARDEELAWELYRTQVELPRWTKDVRTLITTVSDREAFVAELEKRHPRQVQDGGPVFLELAQPRGVDALPDLQRHVRAVFPRWGWFGGTEGKALPQLVALAHANAWTVLWARLLQTSATPELWNSEVKRLLLADARTMTVQQQLHLLTGVGGEWNFSGFGFAQAQALTDEVACLMDDRAPALLRGPFRMHLPIGYRFGYPRLLTRVLAADDEVLVDFFASRLAIDFAVTGDTVEKVRKHFEALEGSVFIRRATHALSMMPAFAIWNYDALLRKNELARLLFERSTPLYLGDGVLVRELLESPQIHVQALGFRVLATDDARAGPLAAAQVDLLVPTLLRPLHRRTRLLAFAAIDNACRVSEAAAAVFLVKAKQALSLPDRKYPREELIGLIGRVLARWPKLRSQAETPMIYRRSVA